MDIHANKIGFFSISLISFHVFAWLKHDLLLELILYPIVWCTWQERYYVDCQLRILILWLNKSSFIWFLGIRGGRGVIYLALPHINSLISVVLPLIQTQHFLLPCFILKLLNSKMMRIFYCEDWIKYIPLWISWALLSVLCNQTNQK